MQGQTLQIRKARDGAMAEDTLSRNGPWPWKQGKEARELPCHLTRQERK